MSECYDCRATRSFGLVCLIFYATESFCRVCRSRELRSETAQQMVSAARNARQSLVRESVLSRFSRRKGTDSFDRAMVSLGELAGDYETYIAESGEVPWSESDPRVESFRDLKLDRCRGRADMRHAFGRYILNMRQKFAGWLENEDPLVSANAVLLAIDSANRLLQERRKANESDHRKACTGNLV